MPPSTPATRERDCHAFNLPTAPFKQDISANISMWMVNLSHCLLGLGKDASLLDLKSRYRGEKYIHQFIKMLPESAKVINIQPFLDKITPLGRIHKEKLAA